MSNADAVEGTILLRDSGEVSWITLNRPERLNSFAGDMRQELAEALRKADAAGSGAVVVTGAGRAFSAGADVAVLAELARAPDLASLEALLRAGAEVVRVLAAMRKPVIAAVNGPATGAGASLAAACDMRIASREASIGFTFVRVGLQPDWGATYHLPRLIGFARSRACFFDASILPAEEAERLGLFDRLADAWALIDTVEGIATAYARRPGSATRLTRASLAPDRATLDAALEREIEGQLECFASGEALEGLTAFLEKRTPDFRAAPPPGAGT
jgi:2-(1,2-epoxy-1,2-dihydrophenyl)acetyl-CoA isomerase